MFRIYSQVWASPPFEYPPKNGDNFQDFCQFRGLFCQFRVHFRGFFCQFRVYFRVLCKLSFFCLQASTTDKEIVLIHSSIEGGSSSSLYFIPSPPPIFNSFMLCPKFFGTLQLPCGLVDIYFYWCSCRCCYSDCFSSGPPQVIIPQAEK